MLPHYIAVAINHDAVQYFGILRSFQSYADGPLLLLALTPMASMFVAESYDCLASEFPSLKTAVDGGALDIIRNSRHRAKLLLDSERSLTDIAEGLVQTAVAHRSEYLRKHRGRFLYWLIDWLQADLGLFRYNGALFSTTHSIVYGFGFDEQLGAKGHAFGIAIGQYLTAVAELVDGIPVDPKSILALHGQVALCDVKYRQLYGRGDIGKLETGLAAACSLILCQITLVHKIIRECTYSDVAYFKQRFLAVYHAQASLRKIQSIARTTGILNTDTASRFARVVSDPFAKWMDRKAQLRNFLVHYRLPQGARASNQGSYATIVADLLGDRVASWVSSEMDRYLGLLLSELSMGFQLEGDPFPFGNVRR